MSAPRLPLPVRTVLDDRHPEGEMRHAWNGLQSKRTRGTSSAYRKQALAIALSSLLSAIAVLFWMRPAPINPLHLESGADVPQELGTGVSPLALDDGSHVVMGPHTRMDVLESTPRTFTLALRHGLATFDVHPGGPRVWKIECGPVTVEVVGTHFTLTRDETKLAVAVERGAVLVSGTPVPDHVVRLGAGQSLEVALTSAAMSHVASAAPVVLASAAPSSPTPTASARRSVKPVSPTAVSADAGAPRAEAPPAPTTQEWLARADEARIAGRFGEAASILDRVVAENRSAASTALAEFSLGRLCLDSFGDPARAAPHFSRALLGGLPSALSEDAFARLVEAYARAGDASAANAVAERYRLRFPNGRRLADVNRWASSASAPRE